MEDRAKEIARTAAAAMEEGGQRDACLLVEETLAQQGADNLADPVSIGALIVSTSGLAWNIGWNIYLEWKKQRQQEQDRQELLTKIARLLAEELAEHPSLPEETRAKLVRAVAGATIAQLPSK